MQSMKKEKLPVAQLLIVHATETSSGVKQHAKYEEIASHSSMIASQKRERIYKLYVSYK